MTAKTKTPLGGGLDLTVTDARQTALGTSPLSDNYGSEAIMDTALATADSGYYTEAVLENMTVNDKIFAVRNIHDAEGFIPSGTAYLSGSDHIRIFPTTSGEDTEGEYTITWGEDKLPLMGPDGMVGWLELELDTVPTTTDTLTVTLTGLAGDPGTIDIVSEDDFVTGQILISEEFTAKLDDAKTGTITIPDTYTITSVKFCTRDLYPG